MQMKESGFDRERVRTLSLYTQVWSKLSQCMKWYQILPLLLFTARDSPCILHIIAAATSSISSAVSAASFPNWPDREDLGSGTCPLPASSMPNQFKKSNRLQKKQRKAERGNGFFSIHFPRKRAFGNRLTVAATLFSRVFNSGAGRGRGKAPYHHLLTCSPRRENEDMAVTGCSGQAGSPRLGSSKTGCCGAVPIPVQSSPAQCWKQLFHLDSWVGCPVYITGKLRGVHAFLVTSKMGLPQNKVQLGPFYFIPETLEYKKICW